MTHPDRPSSFDYEALLAAGRGEVFGEGNAKLPAPPMLMFDRITTINGDGRDSQPLEAETSFARHAGVHEIEGSECPRPGLRSC